MTLYEIDKRIEETIADIDSKVVMENGEVMDAETGEIIDVDIYYNAVEDAFNNLKLAKEEKLDNYGCFIKNLKAEIKAIEEEEVKLKRRREKKEALIDVLESCLTDSLKGEKYESPRCAISFRKSEKLFISVDTEKLPYRFQKTTVRIDPNKVAIKKYIKDGGKVEGCRLVERSNIQIK